MSKKPFSRLTYQRPGARAKHGSKWLGLGGRPFPVAMHDTLTKELTTKAVLLVIREEFGDETDDVLAACRIKGRPTKEQKELRNRLALLLTRIPDQYKYRTSAIAYALGISPQKARDLLKSVPIPAKGGTTGDQHE